jgi:hypothetical protein
MSTSYSNPCNVKIDAQNTSALEDDNNMSGASDHSRVRESLTKKGNVKAEKI